MYDIVIGVVTLLQERFGASLVYNIQICFLTEQYSYANVEADIRPRRSTTSIRRQRRGIVQTARYVTICAKSLPAYALKSFVTREDGEQTHDYVSVTG